MKISCLLCWVLGTLAAACAVAAILHQPPTCDCDPGIHGDRIPCPRCNGEGTFIPC